MLITHLAVVQGYVLWHCAGIQALKALLRREATLVQRNSFLYVFKAVQVSLTGTSLCDSLDLPCPALSCPASCPRP